MFVGLALATTAVAERQIVEIPQPISLLGTDTEDEPLRDGQFMPATIARRPVVVGGAFPESPVAALCLPHHLAGAPDGFPTESNLIVLAGARIHAEWGEKSHLVIADFSGARAPEELGVTLLQIMKLTADCLRKILAGQEEKPIRMRWKLPPGMSVPAGELPLLIDAAPKDSQR